MAQPSPLRRLCLAVYMLCFGIGVVTHSLDFIHGGLRPYSWGPLPFEIFWSALILLDAAVIVLLARGRLKWGLGLALMIMVSDVAVNFTALTVLEMPEFAVSLSLQALFLGFVLGSIGFLWPRDTSKN